MIVAFSGHRPNKLGGYSLDNPIRKAVIEKLREALIELKPEKAISGMALGVDQWAAEVCIDLGIPFIAAIPFIGQEGRWPRESQQRYHELLAKAKSSVIVSPGSYDPEKMQIRNVWMVDNSNILIAIWDGTKGGTGNCVDYAKKIGREIYHINPKQLIISP